MRSSDYKWIIVSVMVTALLSLVILAYAGVTTRVSVASDGTQGNGRSPGTDWENLSISADGRYVAFHSAASNLVSDDTNGRYDVFVRDRLAGTTERVSVSTSGEQGNDDSGIDYDLSVSADGRYVAFASRASDLVSGDTNGYVDVFLRDRSAGTTERVSVSTSGEQGNSSSGHPSVSADGRYVAFYSTGSNLVLGDMNGYGDVFCRDRLAGTTERLSVSSIGTEANRDSGSRGGLCISVDGRFIVFQSEAYNLVMGDTNGQCDIFIRDRLLLATEMVSPSQTGPSPWYYFSRQLSISADDRYVAFYSWNYELVPGDTNTYADIFVRDRLAGTTERVSVSTIGEQGNGESGRYDGPSVSSDGRYVAFSSYASNLVAGDTGHWDVFIRDTVAGTTERLSVSSSGEQANGNSGHPSISTDGRYVAFSSYASNLVAGDTNGVPDVFVHDRWANGTPPPSGSGPGFDLPPSHQIVLANPYEYEAPSQSRLKGQLHCHFFNDAERWTGPNGHLYVGMNGVGSLCPSQLLALYGLAGYSFVCITEHSHCTTDPTLHNPLPINYCEEVTNGFGHVLGIGMNPAWKSLDLNDWRYFPWDLLATVNGLAEVEDFGCDNLPAVCQKIADWGGVSILAHPSGPACAGDDAIIESSKLSAVSIYNAASRWPILGEALYPALTVDHWQNLLGLRKSAKTSSNKVMPIFCASEDDFAPPFAYPALGRTWVLVDCPSADPSQEEIMTSLKNGRYWVYWAQRGHSGTGPKLTLSAVELADGTHRIAVTSDQNLDSIQFVGLRRDLGPGPLSSVTVSPTGAYYICTGSEGYIRVEAVSGDIHIYSQAIGVNWDSSGVGMQSLAIPSAVTLAGTPLDMELTCALPEQLPDRMPPSGYIARAYFVSTTSGVYPPDATFTLSYEGLDVTPFGTSNLAIYRWSAPDETWVRLTSTVDIGNALVTAPLEQTGLYAISAEVIGDTTAPTVTIHTPTAGSTLTGPGIIGVQANDNVGVLRVSFYLDDQNIGVDSTGYDGYTCEFDFGSKSAGDYMLTVVAEDVTGNTGEAHVAIDIASSGVTPTVEIISPINGANLEGIAAMAGTCGDDSLVTGVFVLADGIPVGEADVTGGSWSFGLDTAQLANGPHSLSAMVMDDSLNVFEQGISVTVTGPTLASLSTAKSLSDGSRARLSGRVVTFGDPGYDGAFWIEEQDRSSGIRVEGALLPSEADLVSVSGVMSTVEGERSLVGSDVLVISSSNPVPLPLGMLNLGLGGGALGSYTLGITGGYGLNNIGLLVRVWGKVTQVGADYLYVDDGSNLGDGTLTEMTANVGVRVVCDPTGYYPGDLLVVTGISSCFQTTPGDIARRIVTRRADDVQKLIGP